MAIVTLSSSSSSIGSSVSTLLLFVTIICQPKHVVHSLLGNGNVGSPISLAKFLTFSIVMEDIPGLPEKG